MASRVRGESWFQSAMVRGKKEEGIFETVFSSLNIYQAGLSGFTEFTESRLSSDNDDITGKKAT